VGSTIKYCDIKWKKRLLIGIPTIGWIRYEWAHARYGQVIPINWEASGLDLNYTAVNYSIDDAYNLIVKHALDLGVEWLLTIEDDVILPMNCFVKMAEYMNDGTIPVVSGLYYTKAVPAEPLVFRGRGNGAYKKWKWGEKVWCDGLPMGCLLIHTSLLKWFYDNMEKYRVPTGEEVSRVFETPRQISFDQETMMYSRQEGTQDLYFFDRVMIEKVLQKTGWKDIGRKKYPYLCDTSIFCKHIDRNTGKQYP
jgi:hypothetical protein